jgi:hypothetical protein
MANTITKNVTVATAGTPVPLGQSADELDGALLELEVMALEDNTGDIYIGYNGVDASAKVGIVLHPGDALSEDDDSAKVQLAGRYLSEFFIDADTSGDGVTVVARLTNG